MSNDFFNSLEDFAKALSTDKTYNPEDDPEMVDEKHSAVAGNQPVRVHLIKKNKSGKPVSIIKGIDWPESDMKKLARTLKKACGVGGNYKEGEIIIQGDRRDKLITLLQQQGFKNVKKAGA